MAIAELDHTKCVVPQTLDGPLLNLGCGGRFHPAWVNVDVRPQSPSVIGHDLLSGPLPLAADHFAVVYHSHVLEHVPRERVRWFLGECRRVLRPGGILRVAVPDLEQISRLYLEALERAEHAPDWQTRYDWAVLEMYDQTVRENMGGSMLDYLRQAAVDPQDFAWHRLGADGPIIRAHLQHAAVQPPSRLGAGLRTWFSPAAWRERLLRWFLGKEYLLLQIGRFRRSGEIHHWMFDRYSLRRLLLECGFCQVEAVHAAASRIPCWPSYGLDTQAGGRPTKPDSLYMEALKPWAR